MVSMTLFQHRMVFAHHLNVHCKKQLFARICAELHPLVCVESDDMDEAGEAEEPAHDLASKFLQRERLGTSAIGRGIALPHMVISDLDEPICCIATVKKAIDFDAADGRKVDLFGLLLLPEASSVLAAAQLEQMRALLTQRGLRTRLRSVRNAAELEALFTEELNQRAA